MTRLGFIGLGLMGLPMSQRLRDAGHTLSVWNRSPEKRAAARAAGLETATSVQDLAMNSDIILLCVSDGAAVESLLFGDDGLGNALRAGQIIVDHSSIDPETTRRIAIRLKDHGVRWVDAPVSGGVKGAESGALVVMAGGDADAIAIVSPYLYAYSTRITRMGDVGAGQVTKICNQLIVAANAMLIAEAVSLAENSGVDATLLAGALAGGFADSLPLQILAPRMASRQAEPVQWKVATLLKDMDNAGTLSRQQRSATPLAALAAQLMRLHAASHANDDLSSLIHFYQDAPPAC